MTTKNSKTGSKAKKAVATSTKVTSGAKRAVKRERVQMVKPTPSAPMPAPVFDAPAPVAETMKTGMSGEMKTTPVANGALKSANTDMNGATKTLVANGAMKSVSNDMNGATKTTPVASGAMKSVSNDVNGAMKTTPVTNGAMKLVSEDTNVAMKTKSVSNDMNAMATTPSSLQPVLSSGAMSETATASEPARRIGRADFELMVRRTAYRLAQRRQFRGGSPSQDWFTAEAAVKADLQSRGILLAN
jgi:hypothetical protein